MQRIYRIPISLSGRAILWPAFRKIDFLRAIRAYQDAPAALGANTLAYAEARIGHLKLPQEQARRSRRWLPVACELLCLFDLRHSHLFCRSVSTLYGFLIATRRRHFEPHV
jgi:hypothetical protein